jgi:hypothetical protein
VRAGQRRVDSATLSRESDEGKVVPPGLDATQDPNWEMS